MTSSDLYSVVKTKENKATKQHVYKLFSVLVEIKSLMKHWICTTAIVMHIFYCFNLINISKCFSQLNIDLQLENVQEGQKLPEGQTH